MSDTPRTDAAACDGWTGDSVCVSADFARQLERELAEARKDAGRYRWLRKHYGLHSLRVAQSNLLNLLKTNPIGYRGSGMALDVAIDAALNRE